MLRRLTGKKGRATVEGYGEGRGRAYFFLQRKLDGLDEERKVRSKGIDALGGGTRRCREHPGEIGGGREAGTGVHLIEVVVRKGSHGEERLVRFGSSQIEMLERVDGRTVHNEKAMVTDVNAALLDVHPSFTQNTPRSVRLHCTI